MRSLRMSFFRGRFVFTLVASVLLAGGMVMVLATILFPKRHSLPLELVEPNMSPALSPITGESVQAHFELRNVGVKPITVLRARTSCGCTQVFPTNTPKQVEDVVVPPHSKIKWTVVIDTSSRSGGHQFFVWFDYLDSGTQHTIRGAVRLSIRPCFWANPPVVSVNYARIVGQETAVARFAICDDGREDDLSISKTTVSDPKAIKWSIEEVPVDRAHRHVHSPRIRYHVTLAITPERTKPGSEAQWIRFIPNRDATLLHVPIEICRVPPPFRAVPNALTIRRPDHGDVIIRNVTVISQEKRIDHLVVDGGGNVQYRILSVSGDTHSREVEIRIMRPWKDNYNVRFEDGDKTLTVPIHIIRPLDSNRVR